MLRYTIKPKNLGAHLLSVSIDVDDNADVLTAKIPKWIPGSYKIRDYSRHIQNFHAKRAADGKPLAWRKLDSDTWEIDSDGQAVNLSYDVYAYDLSVRGAYLDDTRMFFNHCCVATDIIALSQCRRRIAIESPQDWRLFTALPRCQGEKNIFEADSYEHQIDCPVESAEHYVHRQFSIADVCHEVVFTGYLSDDDDVDGMTQRIKNICTAEIKLFGGSPLDSYLFMTYLEHKQYGGLEHKNSVAQMASPDMMMKKGVAMTDKMIDFMGLCSHEYFHLWNIKRLQPKDFQPYNLYREQHTEMLWMFEGFTSYYDELFLLRAGVVDANTFLQRQAKNLTRVLNVPGRKLQPLAASSFDAWTKLYQADANSSNNMVSYYTKGAVFALYLDLFIRRHSDNHHSLDDVMRELWQRYGAKGIGIDEDSVFTACAGYIAADKREQLAQRFVEGLHGTNDLDFDKLLTAFGVSVTQTVSQTKGKTHTTDSGLRLNIERGVATIAFLHADSHAAAVGVSVGDRLIAIDRQQMDNIDFQQRLNIGRAGETLMLTLSRRGRVFDKTIRLAPAVANQYHFVLSEQSTALGERWLETWQP
ncbi:MAG: hypothetical protein CSA47_01870 [Gammaproteobacteria bacterium]|nr:MAG: hypothetical protein CSA47_01870 [Gammaproteobacteria bacterium]